VAHKTIINTIRHARTSFNEEKRYAGSIDVPLSERGVLESHEAAAKLSGMRFDVVVTSPLKRAVETAQILVGDRTSIVHSVLCVERNFGVFEGITRQEVQDIKPPVLWIEVGNDTHSVNPQGSEPFEMVWERARKFRNWLFREYAGYNVLVVSHGVFLQMFHGLLRGLSCIESLAFYPSNLELATFCFNGRRLIDEQVVKLASAVK
jgi:broad specificity phosphatase PhoE